MTAKEAVMMWSILLCNILRMLSYETLSRLAANQNTHFKNSNYIEQIADIHPTKTLSDLFETKVL